MGVGNLALRDVRSVVGIAVGVAVPRARLSAVGTRENGHGDETTDECEVKDYPEPAQRLPSGVGRLLDQAEDRRDECVQDGGGKNAFHGAIGAVDTATSLDRVYQAVDLVETLGEDAKGDHGGDKLQDAGQAQQDSVEGCVSKTGRHEACEQTGRLFVLIVRIGWAVERFLVTRHGISGRLSLRRYESSSMDLVSQQCNGRSSMVTM